MTIRYKLISVGMVILVLVAGCRGSGPVPPTEMPEPTGDVLDLSSTGGIELDDRVETWVRTYEGDPRWAALDALQTSDGGYLLVGVTNYTQ